MKKLIAVILAVSAVSLTAAPRPAGCPGPGPRPQPMPHRPAPHHHGHGHGDSWWIAPLAGFTVGAVVGSALSAPPPPPPTVVVAAAPVGYVNQQVWVPGAYVDTVQPNGVVVRTWVAGHWETRTVPVAR